MKLEKLPPTPGLLIDLFEQGLESLGAICDRSWHNQLDVVAEGKAASLWQSDGSLVEKSLHFPAPESSGPRQADCEVFPGCPLTFRLAEALNPEKLQLDRAVLATAESQRPPNPDIAQKHWQTQWPHRNRFQLESIFAPDWHFSLLLLTRCEIQAIDQHWSLHRLCMSWPDGVADETLAAQLDFFQLTQEPSLPWPFITGEELRPRLLSLLEKALEEELQSVRLRQEQFLKRELVRLRDYFEGYARELTSRKSRAKDAALKLADRLEAARTEHLRRRQDQVQRHEIRVIPHLDMLCLLAEPAWKATVSWKEGHAIQRQSAQYLPRAKRWILSPQEPNGATA